MRKSQHLDWKPVHRGAVYCSSGCGGGCTWKEYTEAKKKALALALSLGPKWRAKTNENLGWWHHAEYDVPGCYISVSGEHGSYSSLLNSEGPGGRWVGQGATPLLAVEDALRQAKSALVKIRGIVREAAKASS